MDQLFLSCTIEEVCIMVIALSTSIFGLFKAYCFCKDRLDAWLEDKKEDITPDRIRKIEEKNELQSKQIALLLESDKLKIKYEILNKYYYFYDRGSIDSRSLECLHQLYNIYREENGNSFVGEIMERIDNIPLEENCIN